MSVSVGRPFIRGLGLVSGQLLATGSVWVINQTGRLMAHRGVEVWPSFETRAHDGYLLAVTAQDFGSRWTGYQLEGFGNCAENDAFAATGGYSGMINSTKRGKKQANPWREREVELSRLICFSRCSRLDAQLMEARR